MSAVIVSNSFVVRGGLRIFFENEFNFERVYALANIMESEEIDRDNISFLFLDIEKGVQYDVSYIKQAFKNAKILVFDRKNNKEIFFDFLKHNVDGYVVERVEEKDIVYIVNKILSNEKYYGPELLHMVMENAQKQVIMNDLDTLSYREIEVVKKVKQGYSNKEIANELYVTEHTIKKHITSILSKLNVKNRKELIYNVVNISNF